MIETDDRALGGLRQAALKRQARAAADLQHPVGRPQLQKVDGPAVAFAVGRPVGHDPAGQPAQEAVRVAELSDDDFA